MRCWSCPGSNELRRGSDSLGLRCHGLGPIRYRKNLCDWPHRAELSSLRPRCHLSGRDVISSPFCVDHVGEAIDVKGPEIKEREVRVEVVKERVT